MAQATYINKVAGVDTLAKAAMAGGSGDADKLPQLDADGKLTEAMMPDGIAPDVTNAVASEALASGDWVNLWDDGGTLSARKADASDSAKVAHGYVKAAFALAATAKVYRDGPNNQKSGLTLGSRYYLSPTTAGGQVLAAGLTTTSGHIIQELGVAEAATTINFDAHKVTVIG